MSDREFERAVIDWLEDGTDRTPERAIDSVLLAVKTTPQERDLRIPWRLPRMLALPRASGIAAVALVAVVGAGGLIYLAGRDPGGVAAQPTADPSPATAPSASASLAPSVDVPTGWTPFTSPVYGYTLAYPEAWVATAATSKGQSDEFVSADNDIGVGVGQSPAGDGADLATVHGLKVWAEAYCNRVGLGACDTYADLAQAMCLDAGGDPCRPAILVRSVGTNPEDEGEYAFFGDWARAGAGSAPAMVTVLGVGRGDAYPAAAPFGGAVQLLRTMLSTMGVTPDPTAVPEVAPGITGWTPYTSEVYGYTVSYPEGWEVWPATRESQSGAGDDVESSDAFVSSEDDLGFGIRLRPAGKRADLASVDGLKAWAQAYCDETGGSDCDTFTDRTEPMCLDAGGDPCRAAIVVRSDGTNPDDSGEFAFFPYWPSETFIGEPDKVVVASVGRGDAFPGAAKYGGAVELLKSFLSEMGVTPR